MTVTCDGKRLEVAFDPESKTLTASGEGLRLDRGVHMISIHHANLYKHHNWPQRYRVEVGSDGSMEVRPWHAPHAGEAR